MNSPVRTERLKELRRVVNAAPAERFYMAQYVVRRSCGTSCCAAGWAATDKYFMHIGLHIWQGAPRFRRFCGHQALTECFLLTEDETSDLFGMNPPQDFWKDVKKEHVLANIDRLLMGEKTLSYHHLKELVPA